MKVSLNSIIGRTIVFLILLLFTVTCTTEYVELEGNRVIEELKINAIDFNGKEVTIDWNDYVIESNDSIYYELYINDNLIKELNQSSSTIDLEYNNSYNGKIVATNKKDNTFELNFSFNTPTSKLLFFSDHYGDLTAYDLVTDTILWKSKTLITEVNSIANNKVYSGIGGINAFDIFTGDLVWTSNPSPSFGKTYNDILVDSTNVYAFDSDSNLHCVEVDTDDILWDITFSNHTAPLAVDNNRVYACVIDVDHIYAINKATGIIDWSFNLNSATSININPLVINTSIYFGDNTGVVYSLDKNTGTENWQVDSGEGIPFSVAPAFFDGTIIIGTQNTLYAYDADDGALGWFYTPTGIIETSPFVYKNDVYITVSDKGNSQLVCLDALDGISKWTFNLTNDSMSSPIIYNDVVYCNDLNKKLHAINTNTQSLDWQIKTNGIVTKSPTLVIGNSDEVIYPSTHGLKN